MLLKQAARIVGLRPGPVQPTPTGFSENLSRGLLSILRRDFGLQCHPYRINPYPHFLTEWTMRIATEVQWVFSLDSKYPVRFEGLPHASMMFGDSGPV